MTAHYSNDSQMIQAYLDNKDLYAVIASASFDKPYEDCLEFYPEGTEIEFEGKKVICGNKTHQNDEGKKRRSMAKSILLGILYGRGAASIGEQIKKTKEEAQEIIDKFFKAFPNVHDWINTTIENAHKDGYVEDIAGRRRRLPDIMLPKYSIKNLSEVSDFNPLFGSSGKNPFQSTSLINYYQDKLNKCRSRYDYESIQKEAAEKNIEIKDNTGFISQAERQAVNSRVQGGAATLTKYALIAIFNDDRLRDIGAYLINTVHDEILLEVPEYYSEQAEKFLSEDMINSAKHFVPSIPMKTDTYNIPCWYLDEFFVTVRAEFKKMLAEGLSKEDAFNKLCSIRTESTRDQLYEIVGNM